MTFDPVVQERKMEADVDADHISRQAVTLKEAADIVVKILDPLYKKGKFATKVSVCVLSTFFLFYKQKISNIKAVDDLILSVGLV